MEGNKSAMYEMAGRNRGWNRGARETAGVETVPAAPAAAVPAFVPEAPTAPVFPVIPQPPVVTAPEAQIPGEGCQTLAMAFVTPQKWRNIYEPEKGFSRGTIFAELDLPFVGEGACRYE